MTCCLYTLAVVGFGVLLDCCFMDRDDSLNCCHKENIEETCNSRDEVHFGRPTNEALIPQTRNYTEAVYNEHDDRYDIAEMMGGSVKRLLTDSPTH